MRSRQQVDAVRLCLERGADVDRSPPGGSTPLYTACERCSFEVARLCFEHGADINRAPRGVDWIWPRPAEQDGRLANAHPRGR
mmetsp:Transcript_33803/g.101773  ORF Transcript_33803/g.101773 Transcript_33803/m.101773 type:complete len:83 (-) Transcript_33803:150-398(-)